MAPLKEMLACTMGLATSLAPQSPLNGGGIMPSSIDSMMPSTVVDTMMPNTAMESSSIDIMGPTYVPVNRRSIGACAWSCGRVDVFAIGMDDAVWHKYVDGDKAGSWESLKGKLTTPPTVITAQKGHAEFFARGLDKAYWTREGTNDNFSDWKSLSGGFYSNAGAATGGPGHAVVCGLGGATEDVAYCKQKIKGEWESSWTNLGGRFLSEIVVITWSTERIYVYGIGLNNQVYQKWYSDGKWDANWNALGGNFESPPTVVSWGWNRIDIIGSDKASGPIHKFWDGSSWSGWSSLGGKIYTDISAVTTSFFGEKRIDIVGLGGNNQVYRNVYSGATGKWSNWILQFGQSAYIAPAIVSGDADALSILTLGKDKDDVVRQRWNGTGWSPSRDSYFTWGGQLKKFL